MYNDLSRCSKHCWDWLKGKATYSYCKNVKDIISIPINTLLFALVQSKWPLVTNALNATTLGIYNLEGITATQKHKPRKLRYYAAWGCVAILSLASLVGNVIWTHSDPGALGSCVLAGSSVCLVLTARKIIVCLVKKEKEQREKQHRNVLDIIYDDSDSDELDATESYRENKSSSTSRIVSSLIIKEEDESSDAEQANNKGNENEVSLLKIVVDSSESFNEMQKTEEEKHDSSAEREEFSGSQNLSSPLKLSQ